MKIGHVTLTVHNLGVVNRLCRLVHAATCCVQNKKCSIHAQYKFQACRVVQKF